MLAWPAMDPGATSHARAVGAGVVALTLVVAACLLGALFAGDASDVDGILPVGGAAVVALAGVLLAVAVGRVAAPRVGRSGALLLVAVVALTLWIGATMGWSIVGERSWDAFNKAVAYVAFVGLGIVLAAVARGCGARLTAFLLSAVLGVTLAWALLAKVVPALDPEGDRVARLREPVGYWNALALLADIAVVLGLWLATERSHRLGVRIAGAFLVYGATLALLLTLSRAGVVVAAGVVVLWLAVGRERVRSGLVLFAAGSPALLIGAWAFTRPALTEDGAVRADREADGLVLGLAIVLGAVVVAALVALAARRSLDSGTQRRLGRGLAVLGAALVVAAAAAVAVSAADAVSAGRDCSEVVNDPSRLGSLDPNLRLCWWEEALDVYAHHSPLGAGAGTFETARKRFRPDVRTVAQPHSVPLQQLADGGVVGMGLFVLVVLAGGAACVCALRRLAGQERAAAVALVAAPAAYAAHALVDFNWDFLAVTAPTMVALGALASAGREPGEQLRRSLLGVATVVVAAAVLVSFAFPRLADRAERSSTRELAAGDTEAAREQALWARFFNPLSADGYYALARVAERQGRVLRAERYYIGAVELQPKNPETWYTLGIFQFDVRDNLCAAYRFLNNAYTLDPAGNQWQRDGPLDIARDAVNAGGCAPGS